jgi:membrane dipeptidase
MTRSVVNAKERAEFELGWKAAGVTCIFQNAGEEGSDPIRLLKRLGRFTYLTDHLRDFCFKAVTPDDIEAAKRDNRHCLYLTGNGVPLAGDFMSVPEELRHIRLFYELGIRMMHVTYNRRNLLGDGCAEPANGGLSDLGRAAVAEMNRVGVIVDVAHSGWQTSLEAAKASTRPMVASHTVCDAVNHHVRAKPIEVIKAIVDGGGMIGICCIPNFVGGEGDIPAMMGHIDYMVQRFGSAHVGIGTDIAYGSKTEAEVTRQVPSRGKRRNRYENFWPAGGLGAGSFPGRASLAWTNWPLFTVGMVQRGYSDEDIRKILGQNMLRVARVFLVTGCFWWGANVGLASGLPCCFLFL